MRVTMPLHHADVLLAMKAENLKVLDLRVEKKALVVEVSKRKMIKILQGQLTDFKYGF
jgi:hypothetical protein